MPEDPDPTDKFQKDLLRMRSFEQIHRSRVIESLRKGSGIRYDKFDAMVIGFLATTVMFLTHPLVLTVNLTLLGKVIKDSYDRTGKYTNYIEFFNDFGWETIYYLIGSGLSTYYFTVLIQKGLELCNAGTLAQTIMVINGGC